MKRSTRFIVAFAAAALTYGTLFATLGPRQVGRHGWHRYQAYGNTHCEGHQWRHSHSPAQTGPDRENVQP